MTILKDPIIIFTLAATCVTGVSVVSLRIIFKKTLTFKIALIMTFGLVSLAYIGFIIGNKGFFHIIWASPFVIIQSLILFFIIQQLLQKKLLGLTDMLKSSSSQIARASTQLSSSSQEIANGTTEQASNIEKITSSMEALLSMVKQNAGNAQEASILAEKEADTSQSGYTQMESMLSSINDINKSSEQIKKVIKVIDDIAFQTNILALNAAVEAARAGEIGMGFTVVADEVKNLANKSAEAAKDTANMIEDSIKKTELGLQIAAKLGKGFKDILVNTKKVAEMSKEVETASKQQDTGINQVNEAIIQFDDIVQANASSAEETASSAEELLAQVEALDDIVEKLYILVTGKHENKEGQKVDIKRKDNLKYE